MNLTITGPRPFSLLLAVLCLFSLARIATAVPSDTAVSQ